MVRSDDAACKPAGFTGGADCEVLFTGRLSPQVPGEDKGLKGLKGARHLTLLPQAEVRILLDVRPRVHPSNGDSEMTWDEFEARYPLPRQTFRERQKLMRYPRQSQIHQSICFSLRLLGLGLRFSISRCFISFIALI